MGSPRQRWRRANEHASCECSGTGPRRSPIDDMTDWVTYYEFWNSPNGGHGIMASLVLDGLSIQEVTKAESGGQR